MNNDCDKKERKTLTKIKKQKPIMIKLDKIKETILTEVERLKAKRGK